MIGVSSQRKLQFRRGIRPGSFLPMLKELNMPDQPVTTPASEFQLEVAITILKNGVPWTRQTTQSMQMDQSNAVIAQHVVVESVRQPLFKMGIAAAVDKDEKFMEKYAAIQAVVTSKPPVV